MVHQHLYRPEIQRWEDYYATLAVVGEDETVRRLNQEFTSIIGGLLPSGGKTLEAGCGAGYQSLALARTQGFEVSLMDFAPNALEYARKVFDREKQRAQFLLDDVFSTGEPTYDIVFNTGALEHYTLQQQIDFLKGMASRSRNYVMVFVPNSLCYWYWIRRVQDASQGIWRLGKEVPLCDLSKVFEAAGLNFIGNTFLGDAQSEVLIQSLQGVDEQTKKSITEIHRFADLIPHEMKSYFAVGLGTVLHPEQANAPSLWTRPQFTQNYDEAELRASLSDALAIRIEGDVLLRSETLRLRQRDDDLARGRQDEKDLRKVILEREEQLNRANDYIKKLESTIGSQYQEQERPLPDTRQPENDLPKTPGAENSDHKLRLASAVLHPKPRVAYLTNQLFTWDTNKPTFGGGERYCVTLSKLLIELGLDVTVFQPSEHSFETTYYGLPVKTLPLGTHYSEFNHGACDIFTEATRDYDFVIHNMPEYASGEVRPDAIVICHGLWFDHDNYPGATFRTPDWFEHFFRAFSQSAKVVSVDTNSINFIRAMRPELASRMVYIPNWVDTKVYAPSTSRDPNSKVVIFPRRMQVNRGSRIVGEILKNVPYEWEFCWVGDGDETEHHYLEVAAQEDQRLTLVSADFESMPNFYQTAQICVIPTIASEGTSLSCLEGLASGCAVVSTNVGGLANIIIPGVNGMMTEPNANEIAKAINFLIENPDERLRLQAAALRTAAYFDYEVWKSRWIDLLRQMGWY